MAEGIRGQPIHIARKLERSRFVSLADYRAPFHSVLKVRDAKTSSRKAKSAPAQAIRTKASKITIPAFHPQDSHPQPMKKCVGHDVYCTKDVGYIPSAKKKVKQLKVALGAEGVPPKR